MFGYDDAELERLRNRSPTRRWLVALELMLLATVSLFALTLWLFSTETGLRQLTNRIVGDAPFTVAFDDVAILLGPQPVDPRQWRIIVTDLHITNHDPMKPEIHIKRAVAGMPDLMRAWATQELALDKLLIIGLDIQAKQQRPSKAWVPRKTALKRVTAQHVVVWDAHYFAPTDAPLLEAEVKRIYGELFDVVYEPGSRDLDGRGSLSADSFRTGSLVLNDLRLKTITAEDSNVYFRDAKYRYGGGHGSLNADILDIFKRSTVTINFTLEGARAEQMVTTSTGGASPVYGNINATMEMHTGGDLPRGGAWYEGAVHITEGEVSLGKEVGEFTRDLIRLAPWLELDETGRVQLAEMNGRMRFTRGVTTIHELVYVGQRRDLHLWGVADATELELTLRAPNAKHPERAGVGVVLYGPFNNLHARFATREELLRQGAAETDATVRMEGRVERALQNAVERIDVQVSGRPEKERRGPRWLRREEDPEPLPEHDDVPLVEDPGMRPAPEDSP